MLQGMTLDEAESIKNGDIAGYLKLPPVKLHCSLLAEDAIKKALKDLRKKTDSPEVQELERATAAKSVWERKSLSWTLDVFFKSEFDFQKLLNLFFFGLEYYW